ncbi:VOC family protein [Roseibium porphyridii]|uniref:VOC family protein n=1 Tax=Roseibium porphyridii TaxID=2866279 RepID=UPI003AB04271
MSLSEGAAHVHKCLGIEMPPGGKHPRMSTHNLLMSLGPTSFLEVIAIDPAASSPSGPRWYNLDSFRGPPRILTWIVGTKSIQQEVEALNGLAGNVVKVSRGSLTWKISVPADGSLPLDGAFPTLLQWPSDDHVAAQMSDRGCRLKSLGVTHPEAEKITSWLGNRLERGRTQVAVGPVQLQAQIKTVHGIRTLT